MENTQYRAKKRFFTNCGSPIKTLYVGEYDKKGNFNIVEKGKDNLYAYIQTFADSVDIYSILARFENGDTQALNKAQGMYGDFSAMPKSYADMLNAIYNAEQWFAGLDKDIRAKFDNDPQKFISQLDSPDFLEKVGLAVQKNDVLTVSDVMIDNDGGSNTATA